MQSSAFEPRRRLTRMRRHGIEVADQRDVRPRVFEIAYHQRVAVAKHVLGWKHPPRPLFDEIRDLLLVADRAGNADQAQRLFRERGQTDTAKSRSAALSEVF